MAIDSFMKRFGRNETGEPIDGEEHMDQIIHIDVNVLRANPFQPRKQFDPMQLDELTKSIAVMGVIHPIVVRPMGDHYEIVAGERRWRAATNAGHTTIPALVRTFSDSEMAEIALVENLQRADLNYFEEAEGYRMLIDDFHMTQEEVANKVGKSQPTVANKLRVLNIDPEVRAEIMVEMVSERHIRALLKLKTPQEQIQILKAVYENEMTVIQTEQLIADYLEGRVVFEDMPDEPTTADDPSEPKRQTIRRMFSDMRIYVNTIRAAVTKIVDSGIDVKMQETETEEGITVTITIPRENR